MEEVSKKPIVSEEDRYCEEYYRRMTKRGSDGRYVVSLPFKDEAPHGSSLGNSRPSAFAQFLRKETRLLKMAETKAKYDKVLSEYIQLDHMHPAPIFKSDSAHYYFPHHAVIKPAEPEIQDSPKERDYLHQFQNRPKWKTTAENIQNGMLVVVREDNLPPNEWRLGIVENVITGKDALARVADLRTSRGTIRRPICKLIVVPSN